MQQLLLHRLHIFSIYLINFNRRNPIQWLQKGPQVGTCSTWGPNGWNVPHFPYYHYQISNKLMTLSNNCILASTPKLQVISNECCKNVGWCRYTLCKGIWMTLTTWSPPKLWKISLLWWKSMSTVENFQVINKTIDYYEKRGEKKWYHEHFHLYVVIAISHGEK